MERKIFLIRHLATENNKSGIYMGRSHDIGILESEISPFKKMLSQIVFSDEIIQFFFFGP